MHRRWVDMRITSESDRKDVAVAKIDARFDGMFGLLDHLALLDMAASFEAASLRRLSMRLGDLSAAVARDPDGVPRYADRLIKRRDDFVGLAALIALVRGRISTESLQTLEVIRTARNQFAHGVDLRSRPVVDHGDARAALHAAYDAL